MAARPAAGVTLTRISAEKRGANVDGSLSFLRSADAARLPSAERND
jgi:hypothetical protein